MKKFGQVISGIGFLLLFLFCSAKEDSSDMAYVYAGFIISAIIMIFGYGIYRYEEIKEERRKNDFRYKRRKDIISDGDITFIYDRNGKEVTYNEK